MSLLELKNIGKIYASNGAVAVGIRGVNLSFDRGEFVAITGESGSGKSTLLNVLSGMDTYEEGEMLVEGLPTSHYLQPEWEEYRKKYISFIFQDYNIIESFTVLQNVELSLMHIESRRERRRRAVELLERVGLGKHLHQKGSKLSGGQKQRTVIARALAKDSPIILADEPTGNLDAQTSKEIIQLLAEVSKDKLLIVVTHSFDEVENYATREVRVYDGEVESDRNITAPRIINTPIEEPEKFTKLGLVSNGLSLGNAIFCSKPILSIFMCLLLLVGTLGVTFLSSVSGDALELFKKHYAFNTYEGRTVIARRDGKVMPKTEIEELCKKYSADSYLLPDFLLDSTLHISYTSHQVIDGTTYSSDAYLSGLRIDIDGNYGDDISGKYPETATEVFLYIPLSKAVNELDTENFKPFSVKINGYSYTVVGIKAFRNTNKEPYISFTKEGFELISAVMSINNDYYYENYRYYDTGNIFEEIFGSGSDSSAVTINATFKFTNPITHQDISFNGISFSDELKGNEFKLSKIYGASSDFENVFSSTENISATIQTGVSIGNSYYDYSQMFNLGVEDIVLDDMTYLGSTPDQTYQILISRELFLKIYNQAVLDGKNGYYQVSLFFDNNGEASKKADEITNNTYIAVSSNTERDAGVTEVIGAIISGIFALALWVLGVVFITFFINLCTSRTVNSFSGEMAIMRSMGIPVKVIKTGMYFRMLISAIPSIIITGVASYIIFSYPKLSALFTYLEWYCYVMIFIGVLVIVTRVTRKQVRKLFGESVKKAIRGGRV